MHELIATCKRGLPFLGFAVAGFLLTLSGLAPGPFVRVESANEMLAQASTPPSVGCDDPLSAEAPAAPGVAIRINSSPCQPPDDRSMLALGRPGLKLEPIVDQPNSEAPRMAQPIAF